MYISNPIDKPDFGKKQQLFLQENECVQLNVIRLPIYPIDGLAIAVTWAWQMGSQWCHFLKRKPIEIDRTLIDIFFYLNLLLNFKSILLTEGDACINRIIV